VLRTAGEEAALGTVAPAAQGPGQAPSGSPAGGPRASVVIRAGGGRVAVGGPTRQAGGVQGPQSAVCPVLLAHADAHAARVVGMLASAFARARVRDQEVFARLSQLVCGMDQRNGAFSPLGLSQVCNAMCSLTCMHCVYALYVRHICTNHVYVLYVCLGGGRCCTHWRRSTSTTSSW